MRPAVIDLLRQPYIVEAELRFSRFSLLLVRWTWAVEAIRQMKYDAYIEQLPLNRQVQTPHVRAQVVERYQNMLAEIALAQRRADELYVDLLEMARDFETQLQEAA